MSSLSMSMSDARTPEEQEAHDAKMAAKADEAGAHISVRDSRSGREDDNIDVKPGEAAPEGEVAQRPDDIPEKFWDAEKGEVNVAALLKAQQDAEKALRRGDKPEAEDEPEGDKPELSAEQTNVVEAAAAQYAETGELDAASYDALAKVGISKDLVDAHIAGVKAIENSLKSAAFTPFGGEQEAFDKAAEWAAVNLDDDAIAALDVQLTSTNPAIVAAGAKALYAQYAEANPDEGRVLRGDAGNTASGAYFKSGAEMRAAMSDSRYKSDSAYRDEVAQKIQRADRAGVNLFS